MTIREIAIAIGFQVDDSSLEKLSKKLNRLKDQKVSLHPQKSSDTADRNAAEQKVNETLKQQSEQKEDLFKKEEEITQAVEETQEAQKKVTKEEKKTAQESKKNATDKKNLWTALRTLLQKIFGTNKKITKETKEQTEEEKRKRKELEKTKDIYQKVAGLMKSSFGKVMGTLGLGVSLVQLKELSEEFNGINDQIRDATRGMGDQREIQKQILKSANESRTFYGDTAKFVGNLVREDSDLFATVADAAEYAELTTKLFKAAGKSNEEAAALNESINKSFAKGAVDSETISQLLEEAPEAVRLLEKELGVGKDKLEELASGGKISLRSLRDAFLHNSDDINRSFNELDLSLSDTLLNIRNQWGLWIDDINSSYGITKNLARFLQQAFDKLMGWLKKGRDFLDKIAQKVGGMKNLLKLVAIAVGSIWAASHAGKILDFLGKAKAGVKGLSALLSIANLKMLAIAAVIAMIALLIDDFVHFMRGDKSVIGELFEKMGIDSDAAREKIKNFGTKCVEVVKTVITWVAEFVNAFREGFAAAKEFFGDLVEKVMEGARKIIDKIKEIKENIENFSFGDLFGKAGDKLQEIKENIKDFSLKDFIGDKVREGFDWMRGLGKNEVVEDSTKAASAGVHNRTNNVNQNIHIENTFNGSDPQMQQQGAAMMGKAATDSFEDASNGLAWS